MTVFDDSKAPTMRDTTMTETNVSRIDDATDEQEIGLVAGLVDGHFEAVAWRDFILHRVNSSVVVTQGGLQRGGRFRVTDENFTGLLDWLEAKDKQYGVA